MLMKLANGLELETFPISKAVACWHAVRKRRVACLYQAAKSGKGSQVANPGLNEFEGTEEFEVNICDNDWHDQLWFWTACGRPICFKTTSTIWWILCRSWCSSDIRSAITFLCHAWCYVLHSWNFLHYVMLGASRTVFLIVFYAVKQWKCFLHSRE